MTPREVSRHEFAEIGGHAGLRLIATSGTDVFSGAAGTAISLTTVTINLTPTQIVSAGAGAATFGLDLNDVAGTFTAGNTSSISNLSNTGATAYRITGSSVNATYNGTINTTVGSLGTGVSLTTNSGTYAFTGALTMSCGANPCFTATSSGTVSSSNTTSTLTTTTGTALNVTSTTIAAADLKFRSISTTGAGGLPLSAIILNNTGSVGNLDVLGNGGVCSSAGTCTGGAIQNTGSHAISLTNTNSPSFVRMFINNTVGNGVLGTLVTNFTMTDSTITNWGGSPEGAAIGFDADSVGATSNLSGVVTITGNTMTNGKHGVNIFSRNGTISNATISSNTITNNNFTGSGIRFVAFGTASSVANISTATINGNVIRAAGLGIQVQCGNTAAFTGSTCGSSGSQINITANDAQGTAAARFTGEALVALVNARGTGFFNITGNTFKFSSGTIVSLSSFGEADVTATVSGNTLDSCSVSGCQGIGFGIGGASGFTTAATPTLNATVTNNEISNVNTGILGVAIDTSGSVKTTVTGNTVTGLSGSGARYGIRLDSGNSTAGADPSMCATISNNDAGTAGGGAGIGLRKQGAVSTTNDFGIVGMPACPNTAAAVQVFVGGLNPASDVGFCGQTACVIAGSNFVSCTIP